MTSGVEIAGSDLPPRGLDLPDEWVCHIPSVWAELYHRKPRHVPRPARRRWLTAVWHWWRHRRAARTTVGTGSNEGTVEMFLDELHDTSQEVTMDIPLVPAVQPMWQIDPLTSLVPPPMDDERTPEFNETVLDWLTRGLEWRRPLELPAAQADVLAGVT